MSKVIELRKAIQSILKSKHPNVYYQAVPKDAAFPYVVYDLTNSFDDGSMENFVLEVDGWDAPSNGDTMPLEIMMDTIDKGIQRKCITSNGIAFVFYRNNRLSLHDDDPQIRRRKYMYQVRTFGGEII